MEVREPNGRSLGQYRPQAMVAGITAMAGKLRSGLILDICQRHE